MKRTWLSFCILHCLLGLAPAHVLHEWSAELRDVTRVERIDVRSGDSGILRVLLTTNRVAYTPHAATAYYQTNGMAADAWWEAPASIVDGGVEVDWSADLEPNATVASLMFRLDGELYRAPALLRFLPSPGRAPNALPMPTATIDFATVATTNAPWTLPEEVSAAIAAALEDFSPGGGEAETALPLLAPYEIPVRITADDPSGSSVVFSQHRTFFGRHFMLQTGRDLPKGGDLFVLITGPDSGVLASLSEKDGGMLTSPPFSFHEFLDPEEVVFRGVAYQMHVQVSDVATQADVKTVAAVTNTVSDLVASAVATSPTGADIAVLKLALADLWARVEGIEGLDGYDDVRDAIDAIVGGALTNFAHRADLFGYVPINRSVNGHALQADIALSAADVGAISAAGVAPAPYPARLGEDPSIYIVFDSDVHNLSYSGAGILSVLGCYVPLGPARHLVLGGFDSVSWPSDLHVIADAYEPEAENYYEVGNANGQNYIRFLFAD